MSVGVGKYMMCVREDLGYRDASVSMRGVKVRKWLNENSDPIAGH